MLRVIILLSLLIAPLQAAMVQNDLPTPLFDGRADADSFDDFGSEAATCTPTDVTFDEDPDGSGTYAAVFNGTTSIIACGTGLDGLHSSGTRTVYVKATTLGENSFGHVYTKQTNATNRSWVLNLAADAQTNCDGPAGGDCFNFFPTTTTDTVRNHMSLEGTVGTGAGNYVHVTYVLICTSTTVQSCDGSKLYINGFEATLTHGNVTGTIRTADTGDGFYIGNRPALDRTFDGRIKRTVVFAENLNQFQAEATYYRTLALDTAEEAADAVTQTDCAALMALYNTAADQADPFEMTGAQHQSGNGCLVQAGVPIP